MTAMPDIFPRPQGCWHFLPASSLPAHVGLDLEGQRSGEGERVAIFQGP